jgi:4a-hydroxytetrahydrobiopterin dehydratase
MTELHTKHCVPCEGGSQPLTAQQIQSLLPELPGWQVNQENAEIFRTFTFKNYGKTMAFANAVAWIAHQEDHHPDMEVSYNRCVVRFSTHAVHGLSHNDFISAAKVDQLVAG